RAAIDVVARRLHAAGLGDMCMVVHDLVSDRESVIDQLKHQLVELREAADQQNNHFHRQRERTCQEIERTEEQLDTVHRAYHAARTSGLSYRQLLDRLIKLDHTFKGEVGTDQEIGASFQNRTVTELELFLGRVRELGDLFLESRPDINPWV